MHRRALVAVTVPALVLAACGSKKSDTSKITDLIKDVGKHPTTLCDKYATPTLLAQAGGKAACETASRAAGASDPKVKVNNVTVKGKTAVATIAGNTGNNTIGLVKQGNDWKVVSSK